MFLSKDVNFLFHEKQVIAANRSNGQWIRFPVSAYIVLDALIKTGASIEEILQRLADDHDRCYFLNLVEKLKGMTLLMDCQQIAKGVAFESISLMVTHRCNLYCKHCSVSAKNLQEEEIFDTESLQVLIDEIKECHPETIVLTGGEPMARSDFFQILRHTAEDYSGRITLMTNGTLVTPENASIISHYTYSVDISVDGIDEESCAKIRGKNVFSKVLRAIDLLQKEGMDKISLSMVSTPHNYLYEDAFLELCEKIKVKPILRHLDIIGRAKENQEALLEGDAEKIEQRRKSIQPTSDTHYACTCAAGKKKIFIKQDGSIYPCQMLDKEEFRIGNAKELGSLKEYFSNLDYASHAAYQRIASIDPTHATICRDCPVSLFCWSCLYYSWVAQEDRKKLMQHCTPQKRYLMKEIWGVSL